MFDSLQKNKKGILLMFLSSILACFGQLLWKLSTAKGSIFVLICFTLYGIGALTMIIAYRYGKLSVLQPIMALNYVLGIVFGSIILHESVTLLKVCGVIIIIAGVILIAGGDDI